MPISEPTFEWEDPPKETHRPVSPKFQEPVEVYELAKSQPPPPIISIRRIAIIALVALAAVAGVFWGMRYAKGSAHEAVADNAASEAPAPASDSSANPRAPQVGYVKSWGITGTSASISWSTNVPSTGAVAYGTSPSLGELTDVQTAQTIAHGVELTGLKPATTYYFVVQSADADGVVGYSPTNSFTTIGAGPAPAISDITVVPQKNNQVKISWKTSVPTSSYVQIGKTTNYDRWSKRTDMTTTPEPEIAWVPSGVVHFQVVSVDAKGNQATSPDQTFTEP